MNIHGLAVFLIQQRSAVKNGGTPVFQKNLRAFQTGEFLNGAVRPCDFRIGDEAVFREFPVEAVFGYEQDKRSSLAGKSTVKVF